MVPDTSGGKEPCLRIGVVGPCASGKTTLVEGLQSRGYQTHHIAQEHSYVQDMWQRITNPDLLIYLDVSYEVMLGRKQLNMSEIEFNSQCRRLNHARTHADIYIQTDHLSPGEILNQVLVYLA